MKFVWSDQYSVHVGLIDDQHKKYFDIVNKISDQLDSASADRETLEDIVKEMVEYAF